MFYRNVLWVFLPVVLIAMDTEFHVNHCVLKCKDNHMREMDNEWSHDFTLPLLNILRTTGNETAAFIKARAICTYVLQQKLMNLMRSNGLLEECVKSCNTSQEVSIILAGIKSWQDACNNLEEVRAQFPCWKENGERLSSVCRDQTLRLERDMLQFAKNQSQENIETICINFEHFSQCFIQEHGKYCGYRSEVITARMFENNREAMFKMMKIRWNTLPASCKYTQLRRDTYSSDRFNTRFRRNLLERKNRDEKVVERSKYDDVVKENQILDMKLKAAKQQLLIYTAPSARAATASLMTGRSTFRQQPPSTWRQRPAVTGSIDRPPSGSIMKKKPSEGDKLQLATDEKLTIVRLNRTLKNKNDEIAELKYTIEQLRQLKGAAPPVRVSTASSKTSSNNNNDEEESEDEEETEESEMSELSEMSSRSSSDRSVTHVSKAKVTKRGRHSNGTKQSSIVTAPVPRPVVDQSEKVLLDKLRVAESDLQMLREECEIVKKANERLVQQSLSKSTEYGARESIEEKKKIVELEEQLKESDKRIKESEHRRKEDQKKFEAMRVHYKEKYEAAKAAKVEVKEQKIVTVKQEEDRSNSPPPILYEPLRKRQSQHEDNRGRSKTRKSDDDLLQKLYQEVAQILQSHDLGMTEINTLGPGENSLGRWQKLYAELYEELEKIRNMLVVQYDINQKQTNEITILKDELERLKTLSAEMVAKLKEEAQEKQKRIFLLEEQIRTIAYTGQQPVQLLTNEPNIVPPSMNTDLSVKLVHVKPSPSLTSKFFFSLEFFDFQLETTPIMSAKQQNMDFTTVYDVLVSNLLIHYLQTNGIIIEMYRPANDCYQLIAAGTISLIPLFEKNVLQKFCSEIILKSVETGKEMCTLRYEIEISQPISDSFKKFKKSEMARNMMQLQLETEKENIQENNFEPLNIMINRVVGMESLGRDIEFCVVYELLSFSPFFTDFSTCSEVRSSRTVSIPKAVTAKSIFSNTSISFFLIENLPKHDGVLATLHLPLQPLCKLGGSIRGTFPMLDIDGRQSSISLDLCLVWKNEIPSYFIKQGKENGVEPKKIEPGYSNSPLTIPQPVKRPSKQFDVVPVGRDEPILRQETAKPPHVRNVDSVPRLVSPSSSSSSSNASENLSIYDKDLMSPPQKENEPTVSEYNFPPVAPEPEVHTKIVFDDIPDDEVESVSAKSSHRTEPEQEPEPEPEPEPPIPQRPHIQRQETENRELSPQSPSPRVIEDEDTPRPSYDEIQDEQESGESTPPTQRSVDIVKEEESISEIDKKTEELKSLIGVLPPIAKPRNIPVTSQSLSNQESPPPKPATRPAGLIFSEDLTHSIPPSETSSTSTPRRGEKPPVPLPPYEGRSLIKRQKPISPRDRDILEPDCKVVFQLESLEMLPESRMTRWAREDPKCLIDWIFLDFSQEHSQSSIFELPRRPQDIVDLVFTKEYVLTRGQISLLKQWIQNYVKLELTLIKKSPGDEEELAYGVFSLSPNNAAMKSINLELIDVHTTPLAELQLSIQFSRALLDQLNY
uniref:C2-C2_1 domain-containing protein n=2 Tax=Caenorhabditis japonica TaxID=281687 RepID=A0A8R1DXH8_CAEJA